MAAVAVEAAVVAAPVVVGAAVVAGAAVLVELGQLAEVQVKAELQARVVQVLLLLTVPVKAEQKAVPIVKMLAVVRALTEAWMVDPSLWPQ